MEAIEFYRGPSNPGSPLVVTSKLSKEQYTSHFRDGNKAREFIEGAWKGKVSKPLGTLWGTSQNGSELGLTYLPTDFKTYWAMSNGNPNKNPQPELRRQMRVSAVGTALITSDGKAVFQERGQGLQAGGLLDSAAAGYCIVQEGRLNFLDAIKEKLVTELGLRREEIEGIVPTSVFSSEEYCSGMVGYTLGVDKTFKALESQINPDRIKKLIAVDAANLPDFLFDKYASGELIADGFSTNAGALSPEDFEELMRELNLHQQGAVKFGRLEKSLFVEEK